MNDPYLDRIVRGLSAVRTERISSAPTQQQKEAPIFELRASPAFLEKLYGMRRGDVSIEEFQRVLEWVVVTHMHNARGGVRV